MRKIKLLTLTLTLTHDFDSFFLNTVGSLYDELNVFFFLVILNILSQSIAITDSMFNFVKCFTKKRYNFSQTEIERKQTYFVGIKFYCASNAAIKNVQISRKKKFFANFLKIKS